jgi:hypothetical protein
LKLPRLDSETEKKFRQKVIEKYGWKKGAIEKAIKEAIELWLEAKTS